MFFSKYLHTFCLFIQIDTHNKHESNTFVDTKHKNGASSAKAKSSNDVDVFEFIMVDRNERKIWKFPLNSRCPVQRCREKNFPTRNDAITHFRLVHADVAIWCGQCQIILSAKNLKESVQQHFETNHANISLPTNWATKLVKYIFLCALICSL